MNDLHRIIDANTNRASEGLRVMEDLARFTLSDSKLSSQLKHQRHALRSAVESLGVIQRDLLASRDTSSDVGTRITTQTEELRSNAHSDIASAAAKRAQEALRMIEEAAKGLGISGSGFESIRYAIYDLERDLILGLERPTAHWPVCILITESLCTHMPAVEVLREVARAGALCIQIREKDMDGRAFLEHAQTLTQVAHELGLQVIINDRVDIALACNADGVHLGQQDLPINAARRLLGPTKIIGQSCSSIEQLRAAFDQGADYCGIGPIFPSTTKSKPNLLGIDLLAQIMQQNDLANRPMLAISGINANNINQIANISFPGVAISSAVCSAQNPYEACRQFVEVMAQDKESCRI